MDLAFDIFMIVMLNQFFSVFVLDLIYDNANKVCVKVYDDFYDAYWKYYYIYAM